MIADLQTFAKDHMDLITVIGILSGSGILAWVWKVILSSKKQVTDLMGVLHTIQAQLGPNGGTSMFDMVKQTNAKVIALSFEVNRAKALQWVFAEGLVTPMWEADADGFCVRVNHAMGRLVDRAPSDLLGSGWENIICLKERKRVSDEWFDAVKKGRAYEDTFKVVSRSGQMYQVEAVAIAIFVDGKVEAYLGRFAKVVLLQEIQPVTN